MPLTIASHVSWNADKLVEALQLAKRCCANVVAIHKSSLAYNDRQVPNLGALYTLCLSCDVSRPDIQHPCLGSQ